MTMSHKRKFTKRKPNKNNKRRFLPDEDDENSMLVALVQQGPLGRVVLIQNPNESPMDTLQSALDTCNIPIRMDQEKDKFVLRINERIYSKGLFHNLISAQRNLAADALETIRKICFFIEKKADEPLVEVNKSDIEVMFAKIQAEIEAETEAKTDPLKDNVGYKLMFKMGWCGGGLGAQGQGITEPISAAKKTIQLGLGNEENMGLKKILEDFSKSDGPNYMRFSSEFNNEERCFIHLTAKSLGLTSKSKGKEDRQATVSKRKGRYGLVRELLKLGGETEYYKLHIPPTFSHLHKRDVIVDESTDVVADESS